MEVLRFTLSGKNAFFKKPEVNSYFYFTYGNIHKVAILGMFGAILGYSGYSVYHRLQDFVKKKKTSELTESYPEFYERLKELKISIMPMAAQGYIPKKIQYFNNSVGYASKEQGGNLIVKEQWLENPKWEICLLVDSEEAHKIKDSLYHQKCVYYPYLGKNDHPADISHLKIEEADIIDFEAGQLDCLGPKKNITVAEPDFDNEEEMGIFCQFKYEESLPYAIDGWTNNYILDTFLFTDAFVQVADIPVFQLKDDKKIVFY